MCFKRSFAVLIGIWVAVGTIEVVLAVAAAHASFVPGATLVEAVAYLDCSTFQILKKVFSSENSARIQKCNW